MGQKVNPHGLRVGVIKDWDSKWYAEKDFADNLVEDHEIRKFLKKRLYSAGIYIDGERVIDDMLNEKEKTYTAFESDTEKSVDVQIIKLSECAMSTFGIKPIKLADGEKIEPAKAKDLKIEFIGDSITCG